MGMVGTSPHTRGKQQAQQILHFRIRNIPAYAGKTGVNPRRDIQTQEHPRIRGENAIYHTACALTSGTSPHTRGKLYPASPLAGWCRNIPAYAGKTFAWGADYVGSAEHPRIRGENISTLLPINYLAGTSPHTRGKRVDQAHSTSPRRNIPAYAGKTLIQRLSISLVEEHPRIRGENAWVSANMKLKIGTSPHTRGKPG